MKVLVLAAGDNDLRVAHVLRSEGHSVSYKGAAKSSMIERVDSAQGFEVVVGHGTEGFLVASSVGAATVTSAHVDLSPVPAVVGASLRGLGLAIAARLEADGVTVGRVAIAAPSSSTGPERVQFPRPVGRASGTEVQAQPVKVVECASEAPWAAVLVEGPHIRQAVVDDHRYLEALALAAGVGLLPTQGVVRVWDSPSSYLGAAEIMGMVAAKSA